MIPSSLMEYVTSAANKNCFILLYFNICQSQGIMPITITLHMQASHAAPAGIFVFFLAWSFLIVISFGFPYSSEGKLGWKILFDCLPWSILAQGYTKLQDCYVDSTAQKSCSGFGMLYGILTLQTMIFSCSAILVNCIMHRKVMLDWSTHITCYLLLSILNLINAELPTG